MPSGSTYASMRLCTESAPNKVDFGVQGGAWVRCHVAAVIGLRGDRMVGSSSRWLPIRSLNQQLLVGASDWEPAGRAPDRVVAVQAGCGGRMVPSPCSFLDIGVHFKGGIKVVVNI